MKGRRSIARRLATRVVLPALLLVVVASGWHLSHVMVDYLDQRGRLLDRLEYQIGSSENGSEVADLTRINQSRLGDLNRDLRHELLTGALLLVCSGLVGYLVVRQVAGTVEKDIALVKEVIGSRGADASTLMARSFDFAELDEVAAAVRRRFEEQVETEKRWRRAEQELVESNKTLEASAEELKQERKHAVEAMKRAEEARREAEESNIKLEQAIARAEASAREADGSTRAKSEFLATMSHEIRTPLNGVIGFSEVLADTTLSSDQHDLVDNIRASGNALMALISDVLDFSKIESGRLEIEQREFNLHRALHAQIAPLHTVAARKGLTIEVEIDDAVSTVIRADETRLGQVVINLVGNAIKFTSAGGVRLAVRCSGEPDRDQPRPLEFTVKDTGIGIRPEQLERLFKPFSQAESSTTREFGGTGLGLAISKRLVEAMGGEIRVTSKVEEGTVFTFTLPASCQVEAPADDPQSAEAAPPASAKSEKPVPAGGIDPKKPGLDLPIKIAVAEDNTANQRVVELMLKRLGWTATFVVNGAELLRHLEGNDCELVLMDLQMPLMDGYEATRRIRDGEAGERFSDLPIIALTANAMTDDERRCLDAGMNAYLSKPVKLDRLRDTILQFAPGAKS